MKKTLTVLLIAIFTITSLFAVSGTGTTYGESESVTLGLTVSASDVVTYGFGFTDTAPSLDGFKGYVDSESLPTPKASLDLTYTAANQNATNTGDIYLYWAINASAAPTLTLSTGGGLNNKALTIHYTVEGTDTAFDKLDSAGSEGVTESTINLGEPVNGFYSGSSKLTITTKKITADYASDTKYEDTLTLAISAS